MKSRDVPLFNLPFHRAADQEYFSVLRNRRLFFLGNPVAKPGPLFNWQEQILGYQNATGVSLHKNIHVPFSTLYIRLQDAFEGSSLVAWRFFFLYIVVSAVYGLGLVD